MYALIQTTSQAVFKDVSGALVDVKTIGKLNGITPVFEMLIDLSLKNIDLKVLKENPDCLVKLDGEMYPDNWKTAQKLTLQNNSASGGVQTSSMGDFYPIIPLRRGNVDYYTWGNYEIEADSVQYYSLFEIRNLLRIGDFKTAESRFLSKFWKKVK
jgi:hypothetical protein